MKSSILPEHHIQYVLSALCALIPVIIILVTIRTVPCLQILFYIKNTNIYILLIIGNRSIHRLGVQTYDTMNLIADILYDLLCNILRF